MTVEKLTGHPVGEQLPLADVDLPISQVVFVAFDTETTGLNPIVSSLVELSGVKFLGTGEQISTFSSLINPESPIPPEVSAIHGITDSMVADAPTFREIVPDFIEWATTSDDVHILNRPASPNFGTAAAKTLMLAHNAGFDIGFLEVAMCRLGIAIPDNRVLDTLTLARRLIDGPANYQLQTLSEFVGVPSTTYHRALADSLHVKELFLSMVRDYLGSESTEPLLSEILAVGGLMHFVDPLQPGFDDAFTGSNEYLCIRQALDGGHDVRLQYSGARTSVRVVTPRSVLFARGNYYLSAYCRYARAERTFRMDRVIKLELVEKQI